MEKITTVDYVLNLHGIRKVYHMNMLKLFLNRPEYLKPVIDNCMGNCLTLASSNDSCKIQDDNEDDTHSKIHRSVVERKENHLCVHISTDIYEI